MSLPPYKNIPATAGRLFPQVNPTGNISKRRAEAQRRQLLYDIRRRHRLEDLRNLQLVPANLQGRLIEHERDLNRLRTHELFKYRKKLEKPPAVIRREKALEAARRGAALVRKIQRTY